MAVTDTPMPPYPWQSEIWQSFRERVEKGSLAHALLLSGVKGLGIEALAYAMARFLLCQSPIEDVVCGRCKGCQLCSAESHPDLFMLKREDGAAQIKVDQVRSCVEFVSKTAHANGPKVVLVEDADSMNVNAANALLKSLEEPQGQTVFILTTLRLSSLLPTIRSRCSGINLKVPSRETSKQWIQEQLQSDVDEDIWMQAGGAPLLVKEWLEGEFLVQQKQTESGLGELVSGQIGATQIALKWQNVGVDITIESQLDLLESNIKAKSLNRQSKADSAGLGVFFDRVNVSYLFRLRDKLLVKLAQYQNGANINPAMLLEELAMDWVALSSQYR